MVDNPDKKSDGVPSKKPGCMSRINAVTTFLASIFGIIGTLVVLYQFVSGNTSLHLPNFGSSPHVVASPAPTFTPAVSLTPTSVPNTPTPAQTQPEIVFPYTLWTWFWWIFPGTIVIILSLPSKNKELGPGSLGILMISLVSGLVTQLVVQLITKSYTPALLVSVGLVSVICIFYLIGIYVPEKDSPSQAKA